MSTVGDTLNNHYKLEKKIGEGGFAQVFLATDLELGRSVAVKVLDQSWTSDQEFQTRFRNEARAIASLDHPNILLIHDFGVNKGTPYLVMPYVSGGAFSSRMKQSRLTFEEIGFYLEQISGALDYAHQKGIVHRDIKPANILLRTDGRPVLTDFGLAKLLDNASVEAPTGVLGTVAYMAPEQFHGLVSSASDIYALGILLFQMITGKLPFEGNTRQILIGHLQEQPPNLKGLSSMATFNPGVVAALEQVLAKVLAKKSSERYHTCLALNQAFHQAIKVPNPAAFQQPYSEATEIAPPRKATDQLVPPVKPPVDATEIAPPRRDPAPFKESVSPFMDATQIAPPKREQPSLESYADQTLIAPPRKETNSLNQPGPKPEPDKKAAKESFSPGHSPSPGQNPDDRQWNKPAPEPKSPVTPVQPLKSSAEQVQKQPSWADATQIAPPPGPKQQPSWADATQIAPPPSPKQQPSWADATQIAPPPSPKQQPSWADATQIAPPPGPKQQPSWADETLVVPAKQPARRQVMLKPPSISVATVPDQGYHYVFELTAESMSLGREPDNAIYIPLAIISRHHALLQRLNSVPEGPYYKIIDRKSVNHLYYKGRPITEKSLEDGDLIEIGVRGYGEYIVQLTYRAPVFGFE